MTSSRGRPLSTNDKPGGHAFLRRNHHHPLAVGGSTSRIQSQVRDASSSMWTQRHANTHLAPRCAFASFSLHGAIVPNLPPEEALRRPWDFVCTNCIKEVMQPARCVQTRMGQRVKGRHVSNNMVRMGVEPSWLLGSLSNQCSRGS